MRITVLFFHPFTRRSEANRAWLEAARGLPDVRVRDMYELYPDFGIDVDVEQQVLLESDLVVFQHPFYWYNCPALMKEWLDAVLEYGWAYGTDGDKLKGKHWIQAITTGGPEEAYRREGYNDFTVHELLRPFERTARLCHMHYHELLLMQGAHNLNEDSRKQYADRYSQLLKEALQSRFPPILNTR